MLNKEYLKFFSAIKQQIHKAQLMALQKVNSELINLYWNIGKNISEQQKQHGWGKSVVEKLAEDLQNEFPGIKGFSASNLWRFKNFYLTYCNDNKLALLVRELSWSHNIIIMEKCSDDNEKEFYLRTAKKFGWSKNVLIHQIENKSYEKFLLNQTNFDKAVPQKYKDQAKLAVKDEYTFDFLELGNEHTEKELDISLVTDIRKFLIEMGGYFTFVGNQFRVELGGDEFFIDLLLYNRKLKSLVAIELKIDKFKPEYAGKMQFYLSVLDDKYKLPEENPSIGIIICKDKNRITVEYALKDAKKPIGVATYKITDKLPANMKKFLPSPEDIKEKMKRV